MNRRHRPSVVYLTSSLADMREYHVEFDALWKEQIDFPMERPSHESQLVTAFSDWITETFKETFAQPTYDNLDVAFARLGIEYYLRQRGVKKRIGKQLHDVYIATMGQLWDLHRSLTTLRVYEPPAPPPRPTLTGQPLAVKESRSPLRS